MGLRPLGLLTSAKVKVRGSFAPEPLELELALELALCG